MVQFSDIQPDLPRDSVPKSGEGTDNPCQSGTISIPAMERFGSLILGSVYCSGSAKSAVSRPIAPYACFTMWAHLRPSDDHSTIFFEYCG
jgi:hypothetical protein